MAPWIICEMTGYAIKVAVSNETINTEASTEFSGKYLYKFGKITHLDNLIR